MTESDRFMRRLVESGSPLQRALLETGMAVHVSEETRAAALEAIGLGSRRSGFGRIRTLPFGRTYLLIAAMVISAAAVAIPLAQRMSAGHPEATSVVQSEAQPNSAATHSKPVGVADIESAATNTDPVMLPADTKSAKPNRPNDASATQRVSAGPVARNLLAAELAALDAARARLSAGDSRAALMLLDAYQREFSRPRLALEAEVLRIDALRRSGQTEAARKRAAAFVQAHPKGVLTGRVRRYLEN